MAYITKVDLVRRAKIFSGETANLDGSIYVHEDSLVGRNAGFRITNPTAILHISSGNTNPGNAPLKFTSGLLLTIPEIGAEEFLTDKKYLTISTAGARKEYTLNDIPLTFNTVPYATTNGRLTPSSVTGIELNNLTGSTSNIQQQINNLLSGASINAINGLTKSGSTIMLGGPVIAPFTIGTEGSNNTAIYFDNSVNVRTISLESFASGNTLSQVSVNNTFARLVGRNDTSNYTTIVVPNSGTTGIMITDDIASKGMSYNADYSANNSGNPRWIPDKAYMINNFVDLTNPQSIAGLKTFVTGLAVSFGGNTLTLNPMYLRVLSPSGNLDVTSQNVAFNNLSGDGFTGALGRQTLTTNQSWDLPDKSGTIALLSDLSGSTLFTLNSGGNTIYPTNPAHSLNVNSSSGFAIKATNLASGYAFQGDGSISGIGGYFYNTSVSTPALKVQNTLGNVAEFGSGSTTNIIYRDGRMSGSPAVNNDEFVIKSQLIDIHEVSGIMEFRVGGVLVMKLDPASGLYLKSGLEVYPNNF